MTIKIRPTTEADLQYLSRIYISSFPEEGIEITELTRNLLNDPTAKPCLSLLAAHEAQVIGHILFTRAVISGSSAKASLLAPLAVSPEFQGRGVGGQLIREGLRILSASGTELVFVLGHASYYPRHGFSPAGIHGLKAPYPIPEKVADAWMVLELKDGMLGRVQGAVKCAEALDRREYWIE